MKSDVRLPLRRPLLAMLLVSLIGAMGCSGAGPGSGTPPATSGGQGGGGTASPDDPELVAKYGHGPRPDPAITYQPDVILIGGGPAAIRGVSPDGLVWTLDSGAPGVDQLAEGKVMFASSTAVGRVHRLERKADVVDVTLVPVGLGEVIRDGRIQLDMPVSVDALTVSESPQLPDSFEDELSSELTGASSPDGGSDGTLTFPTVVLAAARPGGTRPPVALAAGSEVSTKVGAWAVTGYRGSGVIGLRASRGVQAGQPVSGDANLKVAFDAHIEVADLRVVADIPVTRGEVGSGHFRVYGIEGLVLSVQGGAVNGLSDNRKVRVELPVELKWPTIIAGFPATFTQKFKFLVETAFTAKNGNLTASAAWDVDGSIGVDGSTVTLPTMTARDPKLIDTLAGVSIGLNAIVLAVSFQFGYTIGLPYAGAGPVVSLITSLGMTNGSSLGIVQCKQVSITAVVSGGVTLSVFDPVKKALKSVLGYDVPAQATLASANILEERWVKPDVVACR